MSRTADTGQRPDDEALINAYVDGELGAEEAAALARRAAREPALAARIATLHQMKAGVGMLADSAPPLPPMPEAVPATAPRNRARRRGLMAAGALALVAAVGAGAAVLTVQLLAPHGSGQTDSLMAAPKAAPAAGLVEAAAGESRADPALVRHDEWVAGYRTGADTLPAPAWLEAPMQAAGLRLVHLAADAPGRLHHGFTGTRDCRLSLFEKVVEAAPDSALKLTLKPTLLRAEWQAQGRRYTMLARDMNRERFTAIAAALHDVSGARRPAGEMLLAGLAESRLPCTA